MAQLHDPKTDLVIRNNVPKISSRAVAERLDKRHDNVLRDIERLIKRVPGALLNFEECSYPGEFNRIYRHYEMNQKGFAILMATYQGDIALAFNMRMIDGFESVITELLAIRNGQEIGPVEIADRLPPTVMNDLGGMNKKIIRKALREMLPEIIREVVKEEIAAMAPALLLPPPPPKQSHYGSTQVLVEFVGMDPENINQGLPGFVGMKLTEFFGKTPGITFYTPPEYPVSRRRRVYQVEGVVAWLQAGGRGEIRQWLSNREAEKKGQGVLRLVPKTETKD